MGTRAKILSPNARKLGQHISESYRKAKQFLKVVGGPKVDEQTFKLRLEVCNECPARKQVEDKSYCNACGCGQWKMAELKNKLWWARLECPKGLFGAVDVAEETTPPTQED